MSAPHPADLAHDAQASSWFAYAASQTPELRLDALVQQALIATGVDAVQKLAEVCSLEPFNADWPALLARALAHNGKPDLGVEVAHAAMLRFPLHGALRRQYWALCEALPSRDRLVILRRWLPHIASGAELRALLRLLPESSGQTEFYWGVVEYHAPSQTLRGWALNLHEPATAVRLRVVTGQGQGMVLADRSHPLLAAAGLAQHVGGFQVRLPGAFPVLSVHFEHGPELLGSPLAAVDGVRSHGTGFGLDSPLAHGRPLFDGVTAGAARPPDAAVDVLIPVYQGYRATLDCVQSVLAAQESNHTEHHVVVLDDAGPDARLAAALRALANQGRIQYVRHEANLGFIRNMNRGMVMHPERDVVWLNADTQVHGNWLDRLQAAAYAQPDIASATPFSNNGELMSFPEIRVAADMPGKSALAQLDNCAAQLNIAPIPLPMGCGFCFYVKRAALDAVGLLDEVHLRRGYGEESDWCLRAGQGGWQHVGVPTVFVAHAGGASFGDEKALRAAQNNAVLRARFPRAERNYQAFLAQDPVAPSRAALRARLEASGLGVDGVPRSRAAVLAAQDTTRSRRSANTLKPPPKLTAPCAAWVILDVDVPAVGAHWLALARYLARRGLADKGQPAKLLALEHSVWQPQWQATGWVTVLPETLGLGLRQRLQLWGAGAAVSLLAQPSSKILHAAADCGLPVYAQNTPAWRAANASPLENLPGLAEILDSPELDFLRRQA